MADAQPPSGSQKKSVNKPSRAKKSGGVVTKFLLLGIIVAIGLFAWAEQQRRTVEGRLVETEQRLQEIEKSTSRQGQEVANEVLQKVRAHMKLPEDPQPTVATIVDVEKLRATSEFYNQAENGDHLIITQNRAVLYDSDLDLIIDVVPVTIDRDQTQATTSPQTTPLSTPTATPTPAAQEGE